MLLASMMRWGASPDPQGYYDDRFWSSRSMMWGGANQNPGKPKPDLWWLHGILAFATWILVIIVLVALARWLWKKGDKEKRR